MEYAVNPSTGAVMQWDPKGGPNWSPVAKEDVTVNPDTKETAVFDGQAWKVLPTPSSGSTAVDVAKNVSTGVTEGLSGLATLPHDIYNFDPQAWLDRQMGVTRNPPAAPATPPASAGGAPVGPGDQVITGSDIFNAIAPTPEGMNHLLYGQMGLPYYVPSTGEGRIAQSAIKGGVQGAVGGLAGAGLGLASGVAGQGAAEAGMPGYVQTAASLLAPVAAAGLPSVMRAGANVVRPFIGSGQRRTAADALFPEHPLNYEAPPVAGTPLTLGQATNDPRILSLERSAFSRTGSPMPETFRTMQTGANQKLVDELQGLGNVPGKGMATTQAEKASTDMRAELMLHQQRLQNAEREAWNAVPGKGITVPATGIWDDYQGLKQDLAATSREDLVPGYVDKIISEKWAPMEAAKDKLDEDLAAGRITDEQHAKRLEALQPQIDAASEFVTLDQLKGLRTRIGNDIAKATSGPQPDRNLANALRQVEDVLQTHMDAITSADPAVQKAIDKARAVTIEKHQTFDDPVVAGALSQTNGFDRTLAANVASRFIKLGGGSQQTFDAYLKATGGTPDAIQAARDYVVANMTRATASRVEDLAGDPFIQSGSLKKFLADNQALINHPDLFTQPQRDILDRVSKTADMLGRTSQGVNPIGGSDTFAKLVGDRYMEGLVGKGGAIALQTLASYAGYQVGKSIGVGGLAGGLGGYAVGRKVAQGLYTKPAEAVRALMDRAMRDPEFAKELEAFKSKPSVKSAGPKLRAFLGVATQETSQQTRQP